MTNVEAVVPMIDVYYFFQIIVRRESFKQDVCEQVWIILYLNCYIALTFLLISSPKDGTCFFCMQRSYGLMIKIEKS